MKQKEEIHIGVREIRRHLDKARSGAERIHTALAPQDLRDDWELFLNQFNRSIGKLIHLAKRSSETRAFGHRLKNASQKDDEALVFLREARHKDEHGLEPSAKYEEGITKLFGGMVGLGPNCRDITFSNCTFNGIRVAKLVVDTDEFGRITRLDTTDPILLSYMPASIQLVPIYSEDKKKTYPVPKSFSGQTIPDVTPQLLSKMALDFLENELSEFEKLIA